MWDGSYFQTKAKQETSTYLPINVERANNAGSVTNGMYTTSDQASTTHKLFYTSDASGHYSNRAIELREVGLTGTANMSNQNYAPALGFHWGGNTQAIIAMRSDGKFYFVKGTSGSSSYTSLVADGYYKNGSSDSYVLLGGGSHKLVSDFASSTHTHGLLNSDLTTYMPDTTTDSGWSMINSTYGGFLLKSIRMQYSAPPWLLGNYSSGIAFGGSDTKAVISVAYHVAQIRVSGGAGSGPAWTVDLVHSGNIGSQAVSSASTAGTATNANYVANDSANMRFHWSGQSGQPT